MKKDPLRQFKVQEWKKRRTHDIECDVRVQADFKMVLYDKEEGFGDDQKIGWLWLNTCFLTQKGYMICLRVYFVCTNHSCE
jgi:hypothetical protein